MNKNSNVKCIRFNNNCVISVYDYLKDKYKFEIIEEINDFSLVLLKFLKDDFIDKFGNKIITHNIIKIPASFLFNSSIIIDETQFKDRLSDFEKDIFKDTYPFLELYTWIEAPVYLPFNKEDILLMNNYLKSIREINSK